MSNLKPTDEQWKIIESANVGSLMIQAYAGCSKSTTLEMCSKRISEPALALAFNKKIVTELKGRLPANFQTKSLNGLGHGAWMRRPGMPSIRLEEAKATKILKDILSGGKIQLRPEQWEWTSGLTRQAMQQGLVPANIQADNALLEDTYENWKAIAEGVGIPEDEIILCSDIARECLKLDIQLAMQGIISYDDQIYCPTTLGGYWPKFPLITVDESQDLSPLNHEMIRLALRPGGRLIVVGDELQAIYSWRGADAQSMRSMRRLAPQWLDLPLTMTFRCPQKIVARQQNHAPGFRAHEKNKPGQIVRSLGEYDLEESRQVWKWADLTRLLPEGERQITILCRNNAPLMSMAFKLIRSGIGCFVLGRDIGRGLSALSRKILKEDGIAAPICVGLINEWREHEVGLALANGKEMLADSVHDRAECLLAVLESGARDSGELRSMLQQLFSRNSGTVVLSSIHRAKGLEWPLVVHLDPWRIPSKFARSDSEKQQEANLRYVCETRTKDVLVMANAKEFQI